MFITEAKLLLIEIKKEKVQFQYHFLHLLIISKLFSYRSALFGEGA